MSPKRAPRPKQPTRPEPLPFEFPGANWYGREEEEAARRVIRAKSPFRYYGPDSRHEVSRLEEAFAQAVGTRYALGVSSGTQALWGFGGRMSEIAGAIGRVQLKKLPRIVRAMRKAKTAIRQGIAEIEGLQLRRLNDPDGDTGAFLIFTLPTAAAARRFADALMDRSVIMPTPSVMTRQDTRDVADGIRKVASRVL